MNEKEQHRFWTQLLHLDGFQVVHVRQVDRLAVLDAVPGVRDRPYLPLVSSAEAAG